MGKRRGVDFDNFFFFSLDFIFKLENMKAPSFMSADFFKQQNASGGN